MRDFCRRQVRCEGACLVLALCFLSMASCATAPPTEKHLGLVSRGKTLGAGQQSFEALWAKQTVEFGAGIDAGRSWQMENPLAMLGGERKGDGQFPIRVEATFLDSTLIDAGLGHYARLLDMEVPEESEFRRAYYDKYDPANHVLVWCELRTAWAENYLDHERWIIFLEDDFGRQYETERILEGSQPIRRTVPAWPGKFQPEQEGPGWEIRQKAWMLCFPRYDVYGFPILHEGTKSLKLVFQLSDDKRIRNEGTWKFEE